MKERLVTAMEAAQILGCSRATIQDLMATGKLHSIRSWSGAKLFFHREHVEALREFRAQHPPRRGGKRARRTV